ncbi:MAG: TIGR03905 family TSCPD domain-containing protein [Oscillospiraceae bacterium]|jgi:uncharacterized protein (TIGR03905 family)|nr:TIGR03905 family TSCPD domain-containing protein [Oscillospiraceae bacterium]
MNYTYTTKGVCPSQVNFDVEDGLVKNIKFAGGCNGNLKAIASLVDGMPLDAVIAKLEGIQCGFKKTSCADQLSQALKTVKSEDEVPVNN